MELCIVEITKPAISAGLYSGFKNEFLDFTS
jgi:hypothetical protein